MPRRSIFNILKSRSCGAMQLKKYLRNLDNNKPAGQCNVRASCTIQKNGLMQLGSSFQIIEKRALLAKLGKIC